MSKVLIIGANGQLARHTTSVLLRQPGMQLTLYLRNASRLKNPDPSRVRIVEGDATDREALASAMRGQDVVYANLAQKGEPFRGHDVSLDSLSHLIVELALNPGMESRHSIGVSNA